MTGEQNPLPTCSDIREYASQTSNCLEVRELLTGRYRGQLSLPYDLCSAPWPKVILLALSLKKKKSAPHRGFEQNVTKRIAILLWDCPVHIYSSRQKREIRLRPIYYTVISALSLPSLNCRALDTIWSYVTYRAITGGTEYFSFQTHSGDAGHYKIKY